MTIDIYQYHQSDNRIPIIIATTQALSGVTTWCYRLRETFRHHPRYRVLLMQTIERVPHPNFDLHAPTMNAALEILRTLSPAIVLPNYIFEVIELCTQLNREGYDLKVLGVCHADTEHEYYNALVWHEPTINHYLAVSPTIQQELIRRMPDRVDDISQVVYGIEVDHRLKRKYKTNPIRLIYAGRLVQHQKRIMDFVPLVQALSERGVSFVFDIVGDGAEEDDLKLALAPYSNQHQVNFWGRVPEHEMSKIWLKHDVFVQVSNFEGTSVAMLEAMAYGLVPVVTLASSGIRSVIRPGINGFVTNIGEMNHLARLIENLQRRKDWLKHVGQQAYLTAQQYSLENHQHRLEQVFDRMMTSSRRQWPTDRALVPQIDHKSQRQIWLGEQHLWRSETRHYYNTVMIMPDGITIGGVTTWTLNIHSRLRQADCPSVIIEHTPTGGFQEVDVDRTTLNIRKCGGPSPTTEHKHPGGMERTIERSYQPIYYDTLPATFIPNFHTGPYATCARLATEHPHRMRVIGYAHTDQAWYYDRLVHYEPIIHKFVAVSNEIGIALSDQLPHRQGDIVVRPYGVSMPRHLDRTYTPSPEPIKLIYSGRLEQFQKNVFAFPAIINALAARNINFHFYIYGQGYDEDELRERLEQLPSTARDHYTLAGLVSPEEMQKVWRTSDICILVSHYEGTSISMLEAMGNGCVPVVSKVSGTTGVINNGLNGFYYDLDANMIPSMVETIAMLDENRDKLAEIGGRAHQTIDQNYSYEQYIVWLLHLIEEAWEQGPRIWPQERPFIYVD